MCDFVNIPFYYCHDGIKINQESIVMLNYINNRNNFSKRMQTYETHPEYKIVFDAIENIIAEYGDTDYDKIKTKIRNKIDTKNFTNDIISDSYHWYLHFYVIKDIIVIPYCFIETNLYLHLKIQKEQKPLSNEMIHEMIKENPHFVDKIIEYYINLYTNIYDMM